MADQQQSLFGAEELPWEVDDEEHRRVATVVLPDGPQGEFDYLIPESLQGELEVGCRVQVPFGRGNRTVTGYCVRRETRRLQGKNLKTIDRLVDSRSLLSPSMLRLTQWMADHYLATWGQVLNAVVPAAVRVQAGTRKATFFSVSAELAQRIDDLDLPEKQANVLRTLARSAKPLTASRLAKLAGCTSGPVTALRKKGLIEETVRRVNQFEPTDSPTVRTAPLDLNRDQQIALNTITEAIESTQHQTVLIHGVTGSGKTEVYIRAIETVVSYGRQAIVLVPEISLTPQTCERFRSRFEHVAVLHSHLSNSQRHWYWQEIVNGNVQVVVGARSAVFAPTPHLGLVVLDEEHESSFKQEIAPRYHARDVARQRAEAERVPLVLASATPSLESWHRATTGTDRLVEMPRRVLDLPLPEVATVDLRDEIHDKRSRGAVSRRLHQAIDTALRAGGQVILLLNRRGFSTHIQCPSCGHVMRCPHCDIALTHHRQQDNAVCHYCEFHTSAPSICPECQFGGIRYGGLGTQRLEAEVRARFPNYQTFRMDTDTMQQHGSHEKALSAFRRGDIDILLGTQMIAKGLDFPNVTLVGVINADTALHFPDFRAAERTFHLVTQVAGRTGRGRQGGRVLVQTFEPDHLAIQASVRHDYQQFAKAELPARREHGYPPFASLIRLVVRGPVETPTYEFAKHVGKLLRQQIEQQGTSARITGPAPAPLAKLRGKYRFHLLLQGPDADPLREGVRAVVENLKGPDDIQWIVDVDPVDML